MNDAPRDACPKCSKPLAVHSIRFGPDDKGNKHGLMYVDCPKEKTDASL